MNGFSGFTAGVQRNIQRFLIINKPHCPKTNVEEPAQQSKPPFLFYPKITSVIFTFLFKILGFQLSDWRWRQLLSQLTDGSFRSVCSQLQCVSLSVCPNGSTEFWTLRAIPEVRRRKTKIGPWTQHTSEGVECSLVLEHNTQPYYRKLYYASI